MSTTLLFAQDLGSIKGVVKDVFGTSLVGANVILADTGIGVITDQDGNFQIDSIPPDSYTVEVSYIGYSTYTKFGVQVQSTGNLFLVIELLPQENILDNVDLVDYFSYRNKETPLSTQTFSAVEIANFPGGNNDVVRVAQSLPGVAPSVGGFRNDLIIRGGAPNEVVYFLDGIELTTINHFSTQGSSGGPAGMLNVSFIDEVTLNSSSFLASNDNALSGVLNFKQREAPTDKNMYNFRLGASESALTFMGPILDKKSKNPITAIASIRRSYLQFLFKVLGLPIRPDYWDYQFKISKKIDNYNSINLIGLGSIDEFSVEQPKEFSLDQIATAEQVPFIEQNTINIGASWSRRFKENKGNSLLSLSVNTKANDFSRYSDNINQQGLIYQNNFDEKYLQLRYNTIHYLGEYKLSAGINLKNIDYFQLINTAKNNTVNDQLSLINSGIYAQLSTSFFDSKLDLSTGFRMDDTNYANTNHFLETFSPRIAIGYQLWDKTKLNFSAGNYFKLPSLTILGYRDTNTLSNLESFKYTQSNHLVLGVEHYYNPSLLFSIEGFYKKYKNYPVSVLDNVSLANKGGDFEVLGNEEVLFNGNGKAYGIELLLQQKFTNRSYGIFSYTYFHSLFDKGDGNYIPSSWDSRNLASFTGGYKFSNNRELSSRFRYAGKSPYPSIDQEASLINYPILSYDYQTLKTNRLPSFFQLDIRYEKKWNFSELSLDFYFEIQNLLKNTIPQFPQYGLNRDQSGELIEPTSLVRADSTSDQMIPTLGFVIDF